MEKKMEHIVLDAGAIIRGYGFSFVNTANNIWTVNEVLAEIRDSKSREFLESLPYQIEVRQPPEAALKAVASFAKKTGDFAALSLTDLKLMALLYALEVEVNGEKNLRKEPKTFKRHASKKVMEVPHTETAICTAESMDLPASSGAVSDFSAGKQEVLQNEIEGDHNHEHASEDISGASSGDDDDDDDNDTSIGEDNDDVPTENIEAVIRGSEGSLFRSHISEVEEEGFSLFDEDSFPILSAARGIGLESGTIFGGIAGGGCETHVDADVGVESLDGQDTESLPASVIAWSSASENATTAKMPSEVLPPSSAPTSVSTPAKLVSWASVAKAPARPAVAIAPATRPQSVWGMKSTAVTSTASTSLGGGVGGLADWSALIREAAATGSGSEVPLPVAAATSSQTNLAGAWSSTATSAGSTHFGETMKSTVPTSAAKAVTTFSSEPQLPSRILSSSGSGPQASQRAAMEDDGEGWIHTANINVARAHGGGLSLSKPVTKHPSQLDGGTGGKAGSSKSRGAKAAAATPAAEVEPAKTACFTTDFSIQNVLIQMGLNVMSADGMLLQKVKQFVLRCIGCYHVHYDMDRLFCSQCGGSSLSRVGATVDSKSGEMRLHLKANYRPCLKGKIFSLPKPGSRGRYDGDFLLREDQLLSGIWKQKSQQIRKDIRSAFGEDVTGDVGLHINKSAGIKVGMGKQNPNSQKGRERRGQKKRS